MKQDINSIVVSDTSYVCIRGLEIISRAGELLNEKVVVTVLENWRSELQGLEKKQTAKNIHRCSKKTNQGWLSLLCKKQF